ncbi:hypothetical protein J6590_034663 [Homalodisca vitripennis]|nr:hypothetical protein J6590_034663 [Homalodisca vitripennis]
MTPLHSACGKLMSALSEPRAQLRFAYLINMFYLSVVASSSGRRLYNELIRFSAISRNDLSRFPRCNGPGTLDGPCARAQLFVDTTDKVTLFSVEAEVVSTQHLSPVSTCEPPNILMSPHSAQVAIAQCHAQIEAIF